jgi:hypothetical protein
MNEGSQIFDDEEDLDLFGEESESRTDVNYQRDTCKCPCSAFSLFAGFIFLFLFLLVSSIVLGLVLPFELGTVNRGSTQHFYNPGDTRTVAYDYVFCEKVTLSTTINVNASLSAVSRQPQLTRTDNSIYFQMDDSIPPGSYVERHFHLHPGSTMMASVNVSNPTNLDSTQLVVLKGFNDFNRWTNGRLSETYYSRVLYSNGPDNLQQLQFTVSEEDDYYFAIITDETATASSTYNVTYAFTRTQLGLDDVEFSCRSENGSTCSVDNVPNRWYILMIEEGSRNATDSVQISTSCIKRPVTFILIPIIPVVVFFALTFILFIPCCGVCKREIKHIMKVRDERRAADAARKEGGGKRVVFRNRHISKTGQLRYPAQKHSTKAPPLALANPTGVGQAYS